MKVHDVKIVLDKDVYLAGEKVTGKLVVKTSEQNWGKQGKAFVKFYDKLDIEWVEDEVISVGVTKRAYSNFRKPFQLNIETFFDKSNAVLTTKDTEQDFIFSYPFEFELPEKLQGTLNVRNAKNQYFIKAYLTDDDAIAKHYQQGVNVFDELFKSLTHTYAKQEVIIHNQLALLPELNEQHVFEAKSSFIKVTVTLPKLIFHRDETLPLRLCIERADDKNKSPLDLHKIGFKLFQVVKLVAHLPTEKVRLFEHLVSHSSRKSVHQNSANGIIVEEFIQIPKDIPPSSSRSDAARSKQNPIRINYKISLEFWKNFLVDDLDVNIPILVDPEA
jgi:hypothetical protein